MYKNILLAVDLEHASSWKRATADAVEFAKSFDAVLHVLTVVPSFNMSIVGSFFPRDFEQKVLEAARTRLHEFVSEHIGDGIPVQHIVGHGTVYEEVLRVANGIDADLVILGASRPLAGKFLLGPNASRVSTHADCSVLVARD